VCVCVFVCMFVCVWVYMMHICIHTHTRNVITRSTNYYYLS